MNSCEFTASVTAIACTIANCVPEEELPVLAAFFGQLGATIASITVQEEKSKKSKGSPTETPVPIDETNPEVF